MKLQDGNLQVYKKHSFTYPPSCILPSFSINASRLLLPKRFWKCASKIYFRKYKQKVVVFLLIYLFNYDSSQVNYLHVECGIWRCLEYDFRQINWNLLQCKDYKNILLFSACVFLYVLFVEKLIALHHGDKTFLFYFDICIKLTVSTVI